MTGPADTRSVLMEKNRMESLTDGIFAFAMTLLVTSMILPGDATAAQSSGSALLSLLPSFYHYIIAFFVLAGFWMAHHAQFSRVHHIDNTFLYMNIIGLFCHPCPVLDQFYRRLRCRCDRHLPFRGQPPGPRPGLHSPMAVRGLEPPAGFTGLPGVRHMAASVSRDDYSRHFPCRDHDHPGGF